MWTPFQNGRGVYENKQLVTTVISLLTNGVYPVHIKKPKLFESTKFRSFDVESSRRPIIPRDSKKVRCNAFPVVQLRYNEAICRQAVKC